MRRKSGTYQFLILLGTVTAAVHGLILRGGVVVSKSPERAAKRLFLLDRDGCINVDVGHPGVLSPDQLVLIPGAAKAIRRLNDAGHDVAIVTNQGCVGQGLITGSELDAIHARLQALLSAQAGATYHALFQWIDGDPMSLRRKPEPGMLLDAMEHFGYVGRADEIVFVGDSWSDIVAARRAGMRSALVATGHGAHVGSTLGRYALEVDGYPPEWPQLLTERMAARLGLEALSGESEGGSVKLLRESLGMDGMPTPVQVFSDLSNAVDFLLDLEKWPAGVWTEALENPKI